MEADKLHYVQATRMYPSDLYVKSLKNMFVAECAILFWQIGLSGVQMLGSVNYMDFWHVAIANPGLTNVLNTVSHVSVDESVYENDLMDWPK